MILKETNTYFYYLIIYHVYSGVPYISSSSIKMSSNINSMLLYTPFFSNFSLYLSLEREKSNTDS